MKYKVTLRKHRATWHWFTTNPEGGGFGSNVVGTKKAALYNAIRTVPSGAEYELTTNDKPEGTFIKL